jgi:TrmH family RNA methyltransferase
MTKNELKYIQSFSHKKHWSQESVFIVEGPKLVEELLQSDWKIEKLYATASWAAAHENIQPPVQIIESYQLDAISKWGEGNEVLALVEKRISKKYDGGAAIVLDGIQDPGNLGTIIRIADWFGIQNLVVSEQTADMYNPKVIQSTMGSFLRVQLTKTDLVSFFQNNTLPVLGAVLDGNNLYQQTLPKEALLLIGNESRGVSEALMPFITNPVFIPRIGKAESLNAAVATGIIAAEWRH